MPADPVPVPASSSPPFDAAWRISTHNSYWVNRGTPGDLFASGPSVRLLDQLLDAHARGLEIDVHPDPATPHGFAVYHTAPGDTFCDTLAGCLAVVRAFHRALPRHEGLQITLELKGLYASTFDAEHTTDDLDAILEDELGAMLYRPADLLRRCPGAETLSACARAGGWPSSEELRGRVVVTPMGNFDGLPGAQDTKDYVDYATAAPIATRAGFPMASSWQLDLSALDGLVVQLLTQDELDRAYAESVFMQIEDVHDPAVPAFLARRGIVRVDSSFTAREQQIRAQDGMQLLQTDYPGTQLDDRGPSAAFHPLSAGWGPMREPGARLALGPAPAGERVFAYVAETAPDVAWETVVSSGTDVRRVGCLRAAAALGDDDASVTVCRAKSPAPPVGAPSTLDAERAFVGVTVCGDGVCTTTTYPSLDPAAEGPGEMLRLEVTGADASCVQARSAVAVERDLTPRWADLGPPRCFAVALRYQGIATPSGARFFATRREVGGVGGEVGAGDFAGVVTEGSGAVGAAQDAAALLVDESAP